MVEHLHLSGCNYGWLHQAPLETALRTLAAHGFRTLELTTAPPHIHTPSLASSDRTALAKIIADLNIQVVSTNPSFCDINLISTNPDFQALSERQIGRELELASDLGAKFVVVIAGRLHALAPAPSESTRPRLMGSLDRLVRRAQELGLTICLENSPYGYLGSSADLVAVADEFDTPHLGVVYDIANALAIEDPAEGLKKVAHRLALTHISDTWREKWAHTSPGRGEVDFSAFARSLSQTGFRGPSVYELIDMEPPDPRLAADIAYLVDAGWSPEAPYQV